MLDSSGTAGRNDRDEKPLFVSNPEQWLMETATGPDLLCISIFRGSWCKWDKHYLRKFGYHHTTTMKKEKITLIAWTSEGPEGAKKADEEWELTSKMGYDAVIGDETNALANWLREDELLPDIVVASPEQARVQDQVSPGSYPNGIVMPAMIWYAHHGKVVFQWEAKFEEPGLGGPGRPEPSQVWQEVLKRKHSLDHGNAVMPCHGKELKMCSNSDMELAMANCEIM